METERKMVAGSSVVAERSLFTNRRFVFLWLASAASSFALSVYALSEEWYVVSGLNRVNLLGVVMMLTMIPRVIFMFVGGTLSDRIERRKLLFLSDFLRGILVGGMTLLVMLGLLNVWLLMVFALLFGLLDAVYWPASRSILPFIVDKDRLTRANSIVQGTNQTLMIAGPAAGAVLIQWIDFRGVFSVIALLLLFGSLLNWGIKEEGNPVSVTPQQSILSSLKDTIAYIRTVPYIPIMMATSIVINFFISGPISLGLPILVKNVIHGDALDLSFLEGSLFIGMVIGSLLAGVANFRKKRAVLNLGMIGFLGIATVVMSQIDTVWFGIGVVIVAGAAISTVNIIGPALAQSIIEPKMMGRVQSFTSMTGMGLTPLSFALVSVLLSAGISITAMLLVSGVAVMIFSIVILIKARVLWTVD